MYKTFSPLHFLLDIYQCVNDGGFDKVLHNNNIEEASAIFSGIFGTILNRHAPLKVVQVRRNYIPWISTETKNLHLARNTLKKEAIDEKSNIHIQQLFYSNTPGMISHNGRIYTSPKDVANTLNDAFLKKVNRLVEKN